MSETKQPEHILISSQSELYDSLLSLQKTHHLLRNEYFASFKEIYFSMWFFLTHRITSCDRIFVINSCNGIKLESLLSEAILCTQIQGVSNHCTIYTVRPMTRMVLEKKMDLMKETNRGWKSPVYHKF